MTARRPEASSPAPVIDLDAGSGAAAEAIDAMHRAFAEYSLAGTPSGALTETEATLRAELQSGTRLAVARLDGAVVAVAKHGAAPDGTLYFGRLGVVPEARGRGIGAAMVAALRAHARAERLSGLSCLVRASEDGNIALYERLGMRVVGGGERVSRTGATIAVVEMRDI